MPRPFPSSYEHEVDPECGKKNMSREETISPSILRLALHQALSFDRTYQARSQKEALLDIPHVSKEISI